MNTSKNPAHSGYHKVVMMMRRETVRIIQTQMPDGVDYPTLKLSILTNYAVSEKQLNEWLDSLQTDHQIEQNNEGRYIWTT